MLSDVSVSLSRESSCFKRTIDTVGVQRTMPAWSTAFPASRVSLGAKRVTSTRPVIWACQISQQLNLGLGAMADSSRSR